MCVWISACIVAGANVLHTPEPEMKFNNSYVYHVVQNTDLLHNALNMSTTLRYKSSYAAAGRTLGSDTVSQYCIEILTHSMKYCESDCTI